MEGWQHYRKIERNARRVHEENGAGVLPASGETAGSNLRALHGEQPGREQCAVHGRRALESVNKSIKGTQSGLKDVNKLLKLDPSNEKPERYPCGLPLELHE